MSFLSPYRVIDLTDERGLLAGKLFGDLGADVIQVEPPEGSSARREGPFVEGGPAAGQSLFWEAFACNRRGITCNPASAEGRGLLLRLCATADFLFESADPGRMAQLGLGWSALREVNPRLVYTSITAFGSDGPKTNWAASDLTLWAAGGALYPNRKETDRAPFRMSLPQAFLHAAADAAGAALIAHSARLASGLGQHVDASAQQSVAQATLGRVLSAAVGDPGFEKWNPAAPPGRQRADRSGSGAATARSKWELADGYAEMHLSMGPAAGKFTNALMAWLREENAIDEKTAQLDWIVLADRIDAGEFSYADLEPIYAQVAAFLRGITKQQLMDNALKRRLPYAPVNSIRDLNASPQLAARGYWQDLDTSIGRLRLPGPFARTALPAFGRRRAAPRLGEHNAQVYGELAGLGADDLAALRARGSI
jgi:crotonobetainyl-CoA:carnitine CoA-transferase CaiB-like acyl-CoA transferase